MEEEEFKRKCPNLYGALNNRRVYRFSMYGMKFKSYNGGFQHIDAQFREKRWCNWEFKMTFIDGSMSDYIKVSGN